MAKGSSKAVQGKYAAYAKDLTWLKNKKKKQARHLKAHPNDEQSKVLNTSYGRKTPNNREWNATSKKMAHLVKQVYGKCDKGIFSPNHLIVMAAQAKLSSRVTKLPRATGHAYSIRERAKWIS